MWKFGSKRPALPDAHLAGGAMSSVDSDSIVQFSTVVSSSLSSRTGAVQLAVVGIAALGDDEDSSDPSDTTNAQATPNAEEYASPGIIGRPLAPTTRNGIVEHMDVLALRTSDGLVPFAYRDLRLKMGGNAPGEGVLAFVGYGGGFLSHTPIAKGGNPAGGGTLTTLYCPFAFDSSGIASKAHAIVLDPSEGNESVMVVHSNGMAITMFEDALVLKNASGNATLRLDDNGIVMTAVQIVLSGGVIVGEPATAVQLLAGPASPASTKFFVSP